MFDATFRISAVGDESDRCGSFMLAAVRNMEKYLRAFKTRVRSMVRVLNLSKHYQITRRIIRQIILQSSYY